MKNPENDRFPQFPTLTALAGALNVSPAVLKALKRAGARGFEASNRVDSGKLLAWLVTAGKNHKPDLTLDEARARLATMRASQIERESKLSEGQVVEIVWLVRCLDESFNDIESALRCRRDYHAMLLVNECIRMLGKIGWREHPEWSSPPPEKFAECQKVIENFLEQYADRPVLHMVADGKSRLLGQIRKGQPENGGKTLYQDFEDWCKAVVDKLSPAARDELNKALAEQTKEAK